MRKTILGMIAALGLTVPVVAVAQQPTTLRVVAHSDLKILDPIWTTAFIVRNHGYMIYDTLFALDGELKIKPQMVDTWKMSDDKLTWTFTLRDGLEFHDGQPVTTEDVIASLKRWAVRDSLGQLLWSKVAEVKAVDAKTFQLVLKSPTGIVLQALGKPRAIRSSCPSGSPRRRLRPDQGVRGFRPLHLQGRRVEARRQDRLCEEPEIQAAGRACVRPGRGQGRQGRPGRVGRHSRPADRGERAAGRRDRHHRIAAARPLSADQEGPQRLAGHHQQVGQPVHLSLQPAAQAVRQCQDPAGDALRAEPEGLPERRHRRSGILQGLQGHVHVRRPLRDHRGLRRQVRKRLRQGQAASRGGRLRQHTGRAAAFDRPLRADQHGADRQSR